MTTSRFVPDPQSAAQQQAPQSRDPPPPPPPSSYSQKRQRTAEQTHASLGDVLARTPPQPSTGIVIRESTVQIGMNVASTSWVAAEWQPTFQLNGKPFPTSASKYGIRAKGVVLPRVWCTTSFCPKIYMLLRTGLTSH